MPRYSIMETPVLRKELDRSVLLFLLHVIGLKDTRGPFGSGGLGCEVLQSTLQEACAAARAQVNFLGLPSHGTQEANR